MIATPKQAAIFWKIVGCSLIALGLLGSTSLVLKEYRLALCGEHATGVVTKVETITTSTSSKWITRGGQKIAIPRGGDLTFMQIAFTTQAGKQMEVETLATFHTEAAVGASHPLIYLPSKPELAKIYSAKQLWLPMIVGTLFSIGCLWLGVWRVMRQPASAKEPALMGTLPRSEPQPQASTPVVIPSLRELYHRDFTFGRALKTIVGGLVGVLGIHWATRPVPGVVIEDSPDRAAMPYIMIAAAIAALIAIVVAVLRHRTLCRTLQTGLLLKGVVEAADAYERRTDDQTDLDYTRTYSRSYVITVGYVFQGETYHQRIRLPLSPSTYGAMQGKEVDLVLLPESPSKPLVREVYLGKF